MSKGIYKYTDLKTGDVVYIGKDSHIDKKSRHNQHLAPSKYDGQPFNRVLQNNPDRYEYSVIWATEDCTTLKLNKMEILFGKIYNPKFNFAKFGKGNGHAEETKQKMSESHKGKEAWNKGIPQTEETKQKISKSLSGKNNPNYGKKHSLESNIKKSKSLNNTSGYFRVTKIKNKRCRQGFLWRYSYYDKNYKRKSICRVSLNKLEKEVKNRELEWREI